jgi:16S rRNA (cytidine1402-2'-O)-methyltransferase
MSTTLAAGLYLVATPIGNLADISLRALETLKNVAVIACEDTRVTAKLLQHYNIKTPMLAYHDHNGARMRPKLLARAAQEPVALVSDAGTPLISDPGYKLVAQARAQAIAITTLPGPNAALAALTLSGLPTDRFLFMGFLPNGQAARRRALQTVATLSATLILYESPSRLQACLEDAQAMLGNREACVARELTKHYEEVVKLPLDALCTHYAKNQAPRGEIVLVIGPPGDFVSTALDVDALLQQALEKSNFKQAVADVAALTGLPRKNIYARALELRRMMAIPSEV